MMEKLEELEAHGFVQRYDDAFNKEVPYSCAWWSSWHLFLVFSILHFHYKMLDGSLDHGFKSWSVLRVKFTVSPDTLYGWYRRAPRGPRAALHGAAGASLLQWQPPRGCGGSHGIVAAASCLREARVTVGGLRRTAVAAKLWAQWTFN